MATQLSRVLHTTHSNIQILTQSFQALKIQVRGARLPKPRYRKPDWHVRKERVLYAEGLTRENKSFVKEVIEDKYGPSAIISGIATYKSPLKVEPLKRGEWTETTKRVGVIARKIGIYPMWLKNGKKISTTLLQVVDNHVVRYFPPEQFEHIPRARKIPVVNPSKYGCLLVGAESTDPQLFTKEYCGLFSGSGVMPKKILARFIISPESAIQPGTPLYATHFRVGDVVDVRGLTISRGFQGVMTRWGFHGMPASHGVTKTHRRPGNIGSGGTKARVLKGQKMPGHMGNRWRILRGLKIWRINTKYNVLYVSGQNIPGATNSIVYIYDTILPLRKPEKPPHFPTFYPEELETPLPEDIFCDEIHEFSAPSITYEEVK